MYVYICYILDTKLVGDGRNEGNMHIYIYTVGIYIYIYINMHIHSACLILLIKKYKTSFLFFSVYIFPPPPLPPASPIHIIIKCISFVIITMFSIHNCSRRQLPT